ncbi:hypothetical protein GCM10018772_35870 [Streptomyces fumanus]|uniref:Uncharacterized protein n=1 Tax=Streptomyces fumanus TaxID=67302 RepID=A0A919E0W5_9ACTN|nr:hypothetical protein GCM10018772_35870 [Streptomyces fumanus]
MRHPLLLQLLRWGQELNGSSNTSVTTPSQIGSLPGRPTRPGGAETGPARGVNPLGVAAADRGFGQETGLIISGMSSESAIPLHSTSFTE